MKSFALRALLLLAMACSWAGSQALAQGTSQPQPITMIVSFPPGGLTDLVGRALAQEMSKALKESVVVVNRAGASGVIGLQAIASSPPNGLNFGFIVSAGLTVVPHLQSVPYSLDSFDYLCRAFDVPVYLLVTGDSRFKTLRELVAYAKANPGKVNYATVGQGSLPHMAALDLERAAGIRMNHVPYKGEGPAVIDLLGKHVDMLFGTNASASTHNLRRLAAASETRNSESPEVPTMTELGYPVVWSIVGGAIAPKGMNPTARARLADGCAAAASTPEYKQMLDKLKVVPKFASGEAYYAQLIKDAGRNRVLLKEAGLVGQ